METSSPSIGKIVTIVLFTLSCIGLLLFLWLSFGGTIPFNPQGYEFRVSFPNADQLADQADVRIAGVSVGKVIAKSLDPQGNRTIATIEGLIRSREAAFKHYQIDISEFRERRFGAAGGCGKRQDGGGENKRTQQHVLSLLARRCRGF